jgi:hypothetical protein
LILIRLSQAQFGRTNYDDAVRNAIEGSANDPTIRGLPDRFRVHELGLYNDAVALRTTPQRRGMTLSSYLTRC